MTLLLNQYRCSVPLVRYPDRRGAFLRRKRKKGTLTKGGGRSKIGRYSVFGVFDAMKYMKQFGIILAISLGGEVLNAGLPLPVPASIYGLLLMLAALCLKLIRVEQVKETAAFLIEIMPMMFIPAAVGLVRSYDILRPKLLAYAVITLGTTYLVMGVSGRTAQRLMERKRGARDD